MEMSKERKAYEQIGVAMTCRSYDEYVRMFALRPELLQSGAVLDVAAGASSFVAEACGRGYDARAADPLYALEPEAIRANGVREIEASTAKLAAIREQFDWSYYGDVDLHRSNREASLERFAAHYEAERSNGRYVPAKLPRLPFESGEFSLVLVSHFLFLYHEQFDFDFHLAALQELMRVCRRGGEVRIYPVITLGWDRYPLLERLSEALGRQGIQASLPESSLPFIPGSKELLRLAYE